MVLQKGKAGGRYVAGLESGFWQSRWTLDGPSYAQLFLSPLSVLEGGGGLHRPILPHTLGENSPTIAMSHLVGNLSTSSQHRI